jgi:hypothetical protein
VITEMKSYKYKKNEKSFFSEVVDHSDAHPQPFLI